MSAPLLVSDAHDAPSTALAVSVVIPCLDEERSIARCVARARAVLAEHGLEGEVVVADNASTDRSAELAAAAGARVVTERRRGYGNAYLAGFAAARGRYIVMADADMTYDFAEIPRFVAELDSGADMVIGNRMDGIRPGAMPWLHRYVGNPLLTGVLNAFFRTGVSDAHCGMRALRRDVLDRLDLRTPGMEFASEMVIRAAKQRLVVRELPIEYHPRDGVSKLSSFHDGWRHLRFLLVHSPMHLFVLPGALLGLLGTLIAAVSISGAHLFGREWQLHSMVAGAMLTIVGSQVVALGVCARAYGAYFMGDRDPFFDRMRARLRLEHGLALGAALMAVGGIIGAAIVITWVHRGLGGLADERALVLATMLIVVGVQVFFSSFLLSILGLRRNG